MRASELRTQAGDDGGSARGAEAAGRRTVRGRDARWGGHAAAILAASSPSGWLFGCDRDGAAVEAATERLAEFAGRFEVRRGNFAELASGCREKLRRCSFRSGREFAATGFG